jgi:hypothetical protein
MVVKSGEHFYGVTFALQFCRFCLHQHSRLALRARFPTLGGASAILRGLPIVFEPNGGVGIRRQCRPHRRLSPVPTARSHPDSRSPKVSSRCSTGIATRKFPASINWP